MIRWLLVTILATAGLPQAPTPPSAPPPAAATDSLGILGLPASVAPGPDLFSGFS